MTRGLPTHGYATPLLVVPNGKRDSQKPSGQRLKADTETSNVDSTIGLSEERDAR